MSDDIRNILDPSSTFSDEDVRKLLVYAQKKKSNVWDTIMFFRRHGQLQLGMDWLREQGDRYLCKLADVLPRLFNELDHMDEEKLQAPVFNIHQVGQLNPSASGVNNNYGMQPHATLIPLTPNSNTPKT